MTEPFVDEGQVIRDYGASVPDDYGGVFAEAGKFVALFTENLAHHEAALREILPLPEGLEVRRGARTWRSIEDSKNAVARLLQPARRRLGIVSGPGAALRDGQFVIVVMLGPYSEERARKVVAAVAPHVIEIPPVSRVISSAGSNVTEELAGSGRPADA
jgi:hypothetical protein